MSQALLVREVERRADQLELRARRPERERSPAVAARARAGKLCRPGEVVFVTGDVHAAGS